MGNKHVQRPAGVMLFKFLQCMSHIDLKSSIQTDVLACAGILFCSLIFVFLLNVKNNVIPKVAILYSE